MDLPGVPLADVGRIEEDVVGLTGELGGGDGVAAGARLLPTPLPEILESEVDGSGISAADGGGFAGEVLRCAAGWRLRWGGAVEELALSAPVFADAFGIGIACFWLDGTLG